MPMPSTPFQPIPVDTANAVDAVFGKGNVYLAIGDQSALLFEGIDLAELDIANEKPPALLALLILVTIFQFAEGLPDHRAAQAIRMRMDWKYALHLPLDYPGIDTSALCKFRQQLIYDPDLRSVFQHILSRAGEIGFWTDSGLHESEASDVLRSVCTLSRLEWVIEIMSLALEALATSEPAWLRSNTLPHWYERYNPMVLVRQLPRSVEEQATLTKAIASDASYLLKATSSAEAPNFDHLPAVQALKLMQHKQLVQSEDEIKRQLLICADCIRLPFADRGISSQWSGVGAC